MAADI